MAYRDLEDTRDRDSGCYYTELFEWMAERELSFVKKIEKVCILSTLEICVLGITNVYLKKI